MRSTVLQRVCSSAYTTLGKVAADVQGVPSCPGPGPGPSPGPGPGPTGAIMPLLTTSSYPPVSASSSVSWYPFYLLPWPGGRWPQ